MQVLTSRWTSSSSGGSHVSVVAASTTHSDTNRASQSLLGVGILGLAAAASVYGTVALCERRNLCIKDPMTEYYSVLAHDEPEQYEMPEETKKAVVVGENDTNHKNNEIMAPSPSVVEPCECEPEYPEQQPPVIFSTSAHVSAAELTVEEKKLEDAAIAARKHAGGLKLFSGNGNIALSKEIAKILGINLGKATVGRFADGEVNVMIHENVRGKDVYIIQPTCPPVNENLMELLLMVSTLNRASARRITVVIPYYGYARQDRKMQVRQLFFLTKNDQNMFFFKLLF